MNTADAMSSEQPLSVQLREWRVARQLTQAAAASALGVGLPTYLNWEHGRRTPARGMRAAIERVINQTEATYKIGK